MKTEQRRTQILEKANKYRWELGDRLHDNLMESLYAEATSIAERALRRPEGPVRKTWEQKLDEILTGRWTGFPVMLLLLMATFWITIEGANVPSSLLATLLIDNFLPFLKEAGVSLGLPDWLNSFLFDGVYLAGAWVVAVMLPPMAIFFPLFTILEDFGYLPRVAFNLDPIFRRAGAHGRQALTMTMGFGCNAAGVVATRVIDSPRERLLAILTNNFSLCNGRWPTQILIASIFVGALVPASVAGVVSAGAVVGVALLGIFFTLFISWSLSKSILKGEASIYSLELPPYRPPRILQTLYTSLIDRTLIILWRAVIFAFPAGAVIWLVSNITIGGPSIAEHLIAWLDPFGFILGLNGVILLAYLIAIPANEIVIPTVLMLTVLSLKMVGVGGGAGVMFELESDAATAEILAAGGWTALTGINLMLFSLLHNPCSTTIYTIYKETKSLRWTTLATLIPLGIGIILCAIVAFFWRLFA